MRVDRLFDALGLTYATCVLGMLHPTARMLRWSNAGHPPPLLVRGGQARFLRDADGIMLGVTAGTGTAEASIDLRPGDLIVLYTDGLVERRRESLSDGLDRLARAAASASAQDAEQVCDAVLAELLPPSTARGDDVALLVVRVHGDAPDHTVHRLELTATPDSPAIARGFTVGVLEGAGWGAQIDTATLLVSEFVTNAVRHGHPPCALAIAVGDGEIEISVEDSDNRIPTVREPDDLDEGGRGFLLVSALAADWGIRPLLSGKAAWFTLRDGADG